jgi:two-component system, OmpR family, sensor histidine kinase KdpD
MAYSRPDPEVLLRRLQEDEAKSRRGQLKIFLGASPGVGKTFSMLEAARAKRADGLDVVVGVVETHNRAETARLVEGLEVLARKVVEYRGTSLNEFDLDAALARHPALLLVDELAHTNAPGSRHSKRWQDVKELLAAGINVYTTLNVQHIESLNDVVAQITGIQVRETVPDSVLEQADEVELVDVTPDVLEQRLREGKVYIPDQAARAIESFFRKGNLIALRELALRRTAERVDAQMRGYMAERGIRETWAAAERLLVCIGPGATAVRMVRATRGMAARLHADWVALYVETPRDQRLGPSQREDLLRALELAEELGGRAVTLSGQSVADEILDYARLHNVNRIVVGKPERARWRERLQGSLLDTLVRRSGAIEVLAISGEEEAEQPRARLSSRPIPWSEYVAAATSVLIPTSVGLALRSINAELAPTDAVMLYLLAVVVVAARYRRGPAVVAALLGIALFDFIFVPPYYTFSVDEVRYLLTFSVMLLVALLMGGLTGRIRSQAEAARIREQRTAALYALSRDLAAAQQQDEVVSAALRHVRDTFAVELAMFLPTPDGRLELASAGPYPLDERERAVAQWTFDHGQTAGQGTKTLPGAAAMYVALSASGRSVGVLGILAPDPDLFRDPPRRRLLEALLTQTAAAIERLALEERNRSTSIEVGAERLRTALLSSLSHDMRTPLASIEGAASTLLLGDAASDPQGRRDLATTILQESQRMGRLVANLLDMIRVETGDLQVHKEWQLLSDVVGVAILRTEDQLRDHLVTANLPLDLPLVPVDEILLEQVFVNLLENAAKHTPPATPVEISAKATPGEVVVQVADRGPGIPAGEEERVFEKFHRSGSAPGTGVGLGLTIARGIVQAHGGRIWAENRPGGGALFRFTIPIVGTPPTMSPDESDIQPHELEVGTEWTSPRPSSS